MSSPRDTLCVYGFCIHTNTFVCQTVYVSNETRTHTREHTHTHARAHARVYNIRNNRLVDPSSPPLLPVPFPGGIHCVRTTTTTTTTTTTYNNILLRQLLQRRRRLAVLYYARTPAERPFKAFTRPTPKRTCTATFDCAPSAPIVAARGFSVAFYNDDVDK